MDMSTRCYLEAPEAGYDLAVGPPDDRGAGIVLREFLAANYGRLHGRLQRHLGCPDLASDCLHDAWLRLGAATVPATVRSPEAYVYRAACNLAMDRLRVDRPLQYTGDAGVELEHIADPSPSPDFIAEVRSDLAAVERAMARLPRRHQAVLVALRIDELSRREVAARYCLSLKCVDTALRQALDYCEEQTRQPAVNAGVSGTRA